MHRRLFFCRRFGMRFRMFGMSMGDMRMMAGFRVLSCPVMLRRFPVVHRSMRMMFSGLLVMFGNRISHRYL